MAHASNLAAQDWTETPGGWELLTTDEEEDSAFVQRLAVAGGWLYRTTATEWPIDLGGESLGGAPGVSVALCFVPDPGRAARRPA